MSDISHLENEMRRGPGRPRKDGRPPQRAPQHTAQKIPWRPRRSDREFSGEDQFFIPPEIVPPGMDWQWKRATYVGKPDISHLQHLEQDGAWDTVANKAWPEKMGRFGNPDEPITLDGLVLMQRPMEYTTAALAEEKIKATTVISDHFQSLGLGEGPVQRAKPSIKVDYSTQLVPEDDMPDLES